MNLLYCNVLVLGFALGGPEVGVPSREATWDEMRREVFDTAWIVPRADRRELEASPQGTIDLAAELEALLERRFEPAAGGDAIARATCVGDLVAAFAELRGDGRAQKQLLARLERERPDVWSAAGWALSQLLSEGRVQSERWDPEDDRDDDGFLIVRPRDLALSAQAPWKDVEGSTKAVQVATLIHADLVAIKAAENDFRTWPGRVGANYESIRPVQGSYLRGEDPEGQPFAALRLQFRCDIPFPFGHYDCDLRMLHRLDENGHLVSDVLSRSDDFYWLAGHDLFLPVLDGQGEWVSMLCVRTFGCDLRGVPDSNDHHEAGAREGVGNMKLEAEKRWRKDMARVPVFRGVVPEFSVHGP
jgi:hypothetical protein